METMEDVRNQPQNIVRKLGIVRHLQLEIDRFRHTYSPIFTDDAFLLELEEAMRAEDERLGEELKKYPDYMEYVYAYWKE